MMIAFVLATALFLAGCVSVKPVVVRDPASGRTETCTFSLSILTMATDGRCTDGTSIEGRVRDGKSSVVGRDRHGAIVTCGPTFNGAICWPSANAYQKPSDPPAPAGE